MSARIAAEILRVLITVGVFLLLMPGLVTVAFALPLALEEEGFYYRWASFVSMMRLGYKLGLPAAAVTGLSIAALAVVLRKRRALYAAATALGAASIVGFALLRNGPSSDFIGMMVAGTLGAMAALICTILVALMKLRTPLTAPEPS